MIIQLNEVPKEGKSYHFDRTTGELNAVLEDVIGENEYETDFYIQPVGQAFDLSGKVEACVKQTCSFCAQDFEMRIAEKFHELLLKDQAKKLTDVNDYSAETDVGVSVVDTSLKYNIGELLHEVIALAEPFQPACRPDCKGLCTGCAANLNNEECRCAPEKKSEKSPFSVLKKLKLN